MVFWRTYGFCCANPVIACTIVCLLLFYWPAALVYFATFTAVVDSIGLLLKGAAGFWAWRSRCAHERRIRRERAKTEREETAKATERAKFAAAAREAELARIRSLPPPPTHEEQLKQLERELKTELDFIDRLPLDREEREVAKRHRTHEFFRKRS